MLDVASLGAGAVVALLILSTVFAFLLKWQKTKYQTQLQQPDKSKSNLSLSPDDLKKMFNWTQEMYLWHNKMDEDGVPVWYVSRAHLRALQEIQKTLAALQMISEAQIRLLEKIDDRLADQRRVYLEDRMSDINVEKIESRIKSVSK